MPHIDPSLVTTPDCNCSPAPDCITIVNSGDTAASVARGILTTGDLTFNYFDILPDEVVLKCAATAVAQVDLITPSGFTVGDCCGNTSTYTLELQQWQCEDPVTSIYTFEATETLTATQVSSAFIALINADTQAFVTAAASGTGFTLTADTAGCAYLIAFHTTNLVVAPQTANVAAWGTHAQIIAQGGNEDDLANGVVYHSVDIAYRDFRDDPTATCENCLTVCRQVCRIYVSDNAGGDTFLSGLSTLLTGAGTAANYFARSSSITSC